MTDRIKEEEFLEKKIKPELQEIIKNIEAEERGKRHGSDMGECVMYFIEEKMLIDIQG